MQACNSNSKFSIRKTVLCFVRWRTHSAELDLYRENVKHIREQLRTEVILCAVSIMLLSLEHHNKTRRQLQPYYGEGVKC